MGILLADQFNEVNNSGANLGIFAGIWNECVQKDQVSNLAGLSHIFAISSQKSRVPFQFHRMIEGIEEVVVEIGGKSGRTPSPPTSIFDGLAH